jgi:archaellum biogenesis ATPase FlaH
MLNTKILCEWPIKFLQDNLYGICTGDLVVIGCDSGCGKSTLSRIITRSAFNNDCPVVLYSLENAPDTFVTEQVMIEYEKDTGNYVNNRQFEIMHAQNPTQFVEYRRRAYEKSQQTSSDGLPLLVVYEQVTKGDWNVKRLIESIRVEINAGYKLFIVDHLDVLVQRDELTDTKNAMDELWALVQEHNIAIITFSQIVKGCNALCPSYDDLRGHKAKVYKSTIIITLGRHEYGYYTPPVKFPNAKPTYIRIAKSRSTNTACGVCYFNNNAYLDAYLPVLCDTAGTFIDGQTKESLRSWKKKQEQKAHEWD